VQDCQWLQRLHSCGLLRGSFRPPESVTAEAVRTLLREKEGLPEIRARCLQQMQKSCDQMNIRIYHAVSDIDGKTGLAIIEAFIDGQISEYDMTAIPGIGYDTASVIVRELGVDFSRFPSERHFAAYIGFALALGKSAGKDASGSGNACATRQGPGVPCA